MKVLVISHAYAERDNHQKLESLSSQGCVVGVVYPRIWRTWHGETKVSAQGGSASGGQSSKIPDSSVGIQTSDRDKVQSGYEEFPLDTFFTGDGGKYFYDPLGLLEAIRRFRPDLIQLEEEPFTPAAFEISLFSLFFKTTLITFTWENLSVPLGLFRTFFEKVTFYVSRGILAGSLKAKERLTTQGYSGITEVIPQFGVDAELFAYHPKESDLKEIILGFVGRPSFAKGIDVLFKALSSLEMKFRLLIVTSSAAVPDDIRDLESELGVAGRVDYATAVPHARLPEYFARMNIFILPSRKTPTWQEQFGRTLIEAMAAGVPVIGSSSGAIPEVIGQAGLIFREEDANDLAGKIRQLADPSLILNFSRMGKARVEELFTFDRLSEKTVSFYRKVCS